MGKQGKARTQPGKSRKQGEASQEHHPVTLIVSDGTKRFEKREIDDIPANDDDNTQGETSQWGFLMPEPVDGPFDFGGCDEDDPDSWLEEAATGGLNLKSTYGKRWAELVTVHAEGLKLPSPANTNAVFGTVGLQMWGRLRSAFVQAYTNNLVMILGCHTSGAGPAWLTIGR